MKRHDCKFQVSQIVSITVVILCFCSSTLSQENSRWSQLKTELMNYPLEEHFDSTAYLNKYREAISSETVEYLIRSADSEPAASDPARASLILEFALYAAHILNDKRLEGICFSKLGEIAFANNEYDLAVSRYTKGLELLIAADSPTETITLLLNFSNLQISREEYAEAKFRAEEGLRLVRRSQNSDPVFLNNKPTIEAMFQAILGEIAYKQGHYSESVSLLRSAIAGFEKGKQNTVDIKLNTVDMLSYCDTLVQLGKTYRALGDYDQAFSYFNEALRKGKDLPDEAFYPGVLNSIALLYMEQRDYETARSYLKQSLDLFEKRGIDFEKADVLLHLGIIKVRLGKPETAVRYLDASLKLYEANKYQEGMITAGNVLGTAKRLSGDLDAASVYFNKSLMLAEKQQNNLRLAETYWHISELNLAKKDWSTAIQAGQKALSFNHTQSNPNLFYLVNTAIGRAFLKQSDHQNSEKYLRAAIQSIETARSAVSGYEESLQLFFIDKVIAYRNLIEALVAQNKFEEALLFSERAKARVLYDSFQNRNSTSNGMRTTQDTNFIRTAIPSLSRDDIKILVKDEQTAFLTYVIGSENIYLCVLTHNNEVPIRVFPVDVKREDLEKRVGHFSREVATHDLLFVEQAKVLYELLIAPAKDLLKSSDRVVIVPDGFLWNLPFQALMNAENNKYLLEEHEISYVPSLAVAVEIRKKVKLQIKRSDDGAKNELLAVGNPRQSKTGMNRSERFADLPEAETEVLALAGIYGRDKSRILTKEKATKVLIKSLMENYRILHFASHGILYKDHPLTSSLLLATTNSPDNINEDGLLTGEEIIKLRLNADLVLLSACESAQGEITNGEGMVGLSWAFIYAGSSNVVASQWKVDSTSTSKLMVEFHRELTKQGSTGQSGAALRRAALKLKESEGYKHPFYWASFIVVGPGN